MDRRQLLASCGVALSGVAGRTLSDLGSDSDGKIVVDEVIPAGDRRQVLTFTASGDQTLTVDVNWPTEDYNSAVGVVVGRETQTPPGRSVIDQVLDTDQVSPQDEQIVIYHWATAGKRLQTTLNDGGEFGATVTMDIARTDRVPSSRPVDVQLRVGVSEHPADSPF